MKEEKVKPINQPSHWHLRPVFVDNEGKVFIRGQHKPYLEGIITLENNEIPEAFASLAPKVKDEDQNAFRQHLTKIEKAMGKELEAKQQVITKEEIEKLSTAPSDEIMKLVLELKAEVKELKEKNAGGHVAERKEMTPYDMAKAIVLAQEESKGGKYFMRDAMDIDKDDYLENGVTFSSYGVGFFLGGDIKNGHYINSPYRRPMHFKYQGTNRFGSGKDTKISHFCSLVTHSKKEIEYLRNHIHYNVSFWESANKALNADARKAQMMVNSLSSLAKIDQHIIIKRCREEGLPVTDNFDQMRVALASIEADRFIKAEDDRILAQARASGESKLYG